MPEPGMHQLDSPLSAALRFSVFLLALMGIPAPAAADCVVLLHGLARGPNSMIRLEMGLEAAGYVVVNQDYPSTKDNIMALAAAALPDAISACPDTVPVHVVTHSMGGILLRAYVGTAEFPRLGRAVMIAPPNRGSEIVDKFQDWEVFDWINGPAGQELATGPDALPARLGPVEFDLGVIAGDATINPYFSEIIPGPDDGVVSVNSTRIAGMNDHIILPASHTFITMHGKTLRQVLSFLRIGKFDR